MQILAQINSKNLTIAAAATAGACAGLYYLSTSGNQTQPLGIEYQQQMPTLNSSIQEAAKEALALTTNFYNNATLGMTQILNESNLLGTCEALKSSVNQAFNSPYAIVITEPETMDNPIRDTLIKAGLATATVIGLTAGAPVMASIGAAGIAVQLVTGK